MNVATLSATLFRSPSLLAMLLLLLLSFLPPLFFPRLLLPLERVVIMLGMRLLSLVLWLLRRDVEFWVGVVGEAGNVLDAESARLRDENSLAEGDGESAEFRSRALGLGPAALLTSFWRKLGAMHPVMCAQIIRCHRALMVAIDKVVGLPRSPEVNATKHNKFKRNRR